MRTEVISGSVQLTLESDQKRAFWRSTGRLAAGYWGLYLIINSVLWGMAGIDPVKTFIPKLFLIAFCAVTTIALSAVLYRMRHRPFAVQALISLGFASLMALAFTAVDHLIHTVAVFPKPVTFDLTYAAYSTIEGLALFFGWASLSISLIHAAQARGQERLAALATKEAINAQMRALRYQINPHFLFNSLNAITGLIEENAPERASRMVLSLSSFLRSTLALDPLKDVRLADEIELQQDYLAIERERFGDRLSVSIHIEEGAGDALVPSLILQPLVENAMKHGTGAMTGRVDIQIMAKIEDERLRVSIDNSAPDVPRHDDGGDGIGLRNVSERLAMRFGHAASLTYGRRGADRFRVDLVIPLHIA